MTIGIPSLNGQDRIDDAPVEGNEFSDALSQFEEDAGGPHTNRYLKIATLLKRLCRCLRRTPGFEN